MDTNLGLPVTFQLSPVVARILIDKYHTNGGVIPNGGKFSPLQGYLHVIERLLQDHIDKLNELKTDSGVIGTNITILQLHRLKAEIWGLIPEQMRISKRIDGQDRIAMRCYGYGDKLLFSFDLFLGGSFVYIAEGDLDTVKQLVGLNREAVGKVLQNLRDRKDK